MLVQYSSMDPTFNSYHPVVSPRLFGLTLLEFRMVKSAIRWKTSTHAIEASLPKLTETLGTPLHLDTPVIQSVHAGYCPNAVGSSSCPVRWR